jgi:hypothetical protein
MAGTWNAIEICLNDDHLSLSANLIYLGMSSGMSIGCAWGVHLSVYLIVHVAQFF